MNTPLRDKSVVVRALALKLGIPLSRVACVGNSAPDVTMFRCAGMGIAFRPADRHVVAHADVTVDGNDLRAVLLPILGSA